MVALPSHSSQLPSPGAFAFFASVAGLKGSIYWQKPPFLIALRFAEDI